MYIDSQEFRNLCEAIEDAAWEDGTLGMNVLETMHEMGQSQFLIHDEAARLTGDYMVNLSVLQELVCDVWCPDFDCVNY